MSKESLTRSSVLRREILRKLIHISCGVVISLIYAIVHKNFIIAGLLFCLSTIFFFEALRLKGVLSVPLLRNREKKKLGGRTFFIMGALMSILLFDKSIAIASLFMLAIGDAASGIAQVVKRGTFDSGAGFKRGIKPPDVMLVMFTVSFVLGYCIVDPLGMAILGAIGATIADGVHLRIYGVTIDDNLTIPLYSGFLMTIAS